MSSEHPEALRLAAQLEDTESARLHLLPYAAAALRNLHTENTALRVTEDNLRQELQECQEQRRAAFRRIEELDREIDAMRAQVGKSESVASIWGAFPGYLIDNCEGETISEEGLQRALADMLSDQKYTHPAPQQKPLTDEHRQELALTLMAAKLAPSGSVPVHCAAFVALCAAHRIGEKK